MSDSVIPESLRGESLQSAVAPVFHKVRMPLLSESLIRAQELCPNLVERHGVVLAVRELSLQSFPDWQERAKRAGVKEMSCPEAHVSDAEVFDLGPLDFGRERMLLVVV